MAEADELRVWAISLPVLPAAAASVDQLARHLDFMAAALPSRGNDVETGRRRAAVYASILSGKSNDALAFMARTACMTLEWFPSPKQCLDILDQFRPPETPTPRSLALLECSRFAAQTYATWLADLRAGLPVGEAPERWKRIAVEQGDMRRLSDGSYVSRALYHGPPQPPYRDPVIQRAPAASTPSQAVPFPAVAGTSEGLAP